MTPSVGSMREFTFRRACLRLAAAVTAVLAVLALGATPAHAAPPEGFSWSATIDEQPLERVDSQNPLPLGDDELTRIQVVLNNAGTSEVRIRSVRLSGEVIGLTFFSFAVRVDIALPPGQSTERRFEVDLDALTDQAVGLIPSQVALLNPNREVIDAKDFPVDVQGSATSVYGVFGLAVAGITAVLLASLLLAVRRHRLPTNWWQRGLRFLPVGLGAGLTLTFSLSAFGLLVPSAGTWVTFVLALGAGAFLVGYFLPQGRRPEDQAPDDESDDDDDDLYDDQAGQERRDELMPDRGPMALQGGSARPDPGGSAP